MPIPDYETLMLPVLRFAAKSGGSEVSTPEAARVLANEFSLSEEERTALLPSGIPRCGPISSPSLVHPQTTGRNT
jgi:restriction system protein